ncbi:SAM-dependent methyltransferase [Runella zeae]|uniref:SAM-dependent methyltransferase n=1 Tax=Runella zeae TaxID=94255 RepID=UPI00048F0F8D|nr:SAM-dependent methyltransferase [Runella zeae]
MTISDALIERENYTPPSNPTEFQEAILFAEISETGTIIFKPLGRKLYVSVNTALETIGCKWDRKSKCTTSNLSHDALLTALKSIIKNEEENPRKKYQFFETPSSVADRMIELAELKPYHRALEPSAGRGAIIKAALKKIPSIRFDAIELWDVNANILQSTLGDKLKTIGCLDFLEWEPVNTLYDRIVANPPFANNQDIDHIKKMYSLLSLGGRLVSISSTHWTFAKEKKCEAFREWLIDVDANIYDIEADSFEYTKIATKLIVIDKVKYTDVS